MINKALFSSDTCEWATPQDFFNLLNREINFTLDPCCTHENAKCTKHYTREDNGLEQSWYNERVYCNPPYGSEIYLWVKKCYEESLKGALCVMLIPARTDTRYFHDFIYGKAQVRFVRGRLKFGGSQNSAPFPSMVVIFDGRMRQYQWCIPNTNITNHQNIHQWNFIK